MIHPTFDSLVEKFNILEDVSSGQMFGKPCIKIGKKAFIAWFKTEMVFKLGQEEIVLIIQQYQGAVNWDPSGKNRPMKDWLQVPLEYSVDYEQLAQQALDFVEKSNVVK